MLLSFMTKEEVFITAGDSIKLLKMCLYSFSLGVEWGTNNSSKERSMIRNVRIRVAKF
jgi:hypothetical protein